MAITSEQVTEYFASVGITLPSFMIDCIVEKVNTVEQCMIDNGYAACDITMSLLLAAGLIGISMGAKKVSSNSVDVVSESYRFESLDDLQSLLDANLALYDPAGCTNSVTPTKVNPSFMFVSTPCKG